MAGRCFFYFAFGSNLLRERLVLKNPSAEFATIGKLADYELVFVGHGTRWEGGVANIQQREGRAVWGVVWRMDTHDLPNLNAQESIYTPMEVEVRDPEGEVYRCRTYQLRLPGVWKEAKLPSPHYKDVIVRGARQNHLPEDYLRALEEMPDNGYQGKLPVYDDVIQMLSNGGTEAKG